ncbi:LysR substrate-binding domain-containing protein, partial [Achromobacter xylosoxidans]|nr:LysR substrate-binding domain-containing protein [Achromobacter xylosoxidans]
LDAGTAAPAWIVCPDHPSHQRLLPYYGAAANAPAGQAGSLRLALELVAAGVGACVAPHSLIAQQADVAIHDLDGLALSRRIGLCYAAQALDKPALALLTEHLREAGQG